MKKLSLITLNTFAAIGCLSFAVGAHAAMSKTEYEAAKDNISAKYESEKMACKAMTGNAKDVCQEGAKGREKVSKAELEAGYEPTEKHQYEWKVAKADADYAVAKEKCDDKTGNAKEVCRKEAKAAHVSALADAKTTEKVADANNTARTKNRETRQDAAADKRDAEYAVAKEKCEVLMDAAKANCVKEAKVRYAQ